MTRTHAPLSAGANPASKIVDLAAYREARLGDRERMPLFARTPEPMPPAPRRVLSDNDVAHRTLMLRHLEAGLT